MLNPIQLIHMIQGGGNPMQMLSQASQSNPVVGQVLRMTNGRTPAEMRNMAYEVARQRGVDINQVAQSMGLRLPK